MVQRVYYGSVCQGDGSFGIVFLDFLGCVSAGDTMEEVIAMGHEALQFHIDAMVEDGDPIPMAQSVSLERTAIEMNDGDDPVAGEDWVAVVPILVEVRDRNSAVPVAIEASLLREVGSVARNREKFIMDATRRELKRLQKSA